MTLKDQMADDVDRVFLSTDDFAAAATYVPDTEDTDGFAVDLVEGDVDEQFVATDSGIAEQRRAQFSGSLAVIRAGIAVLEGSARDPRRGDRLVFTTGSAAGTWSIERHAPDLGGGVVLFARLETRFASGGQGAMGSA